jgi:hypothetical protein
MSLLDALFGLLTGILALAAMWRIVCIGKDAKLHIWRGSRNRFMLLAAPYALAFVGLTAFLIGRDYADRLLVLAVVGMLFAYRNPFGR